MNISGSPSPPIDQNPKETREHQSQQMDQFGYSSGQLWCKHLVKEAPGTCVEGGLSVGTTPYPSANTATPMSWSRVQACPGATHDLPQGNLGDALKALLQRVAESTDKQQPLPVSDYKTFIKYFGEFPPGVSPDQLDSEDYFLKIKNDPCFFSEVPLEKLTPEMCIQAFVTAPYANIQYIPDSMKTNELCRALVIDELNAIDHVPGEIIKQWLNDGFFDFLLENYKGAIKYIPEAARTDAHFEIACKKSHVALNYYPENKPVSDRLLTIAIEHTGALEFYPDHKKTAELCQVACRRNGLALEYVPEQLKTAELCQLAVDNNARALEFIPEAVKTFDMCLAAAKGGKLSGTLPKFLTETQRTEIYRTACTSGYFVLYDIPEQYITDHFLKSVITSQEYRDNPLKFAATDNLSKWVGADKASELYALAVSLSSEALRYVPSDFKKGAILDAALKNNLSAFQHVSLEHLSFNELCLMAAVTKEIVKPLCSKEERLLFRLIKLNQLPYVPTDVQLKFLTCPDISLKDKISFIESLDAPTYTFPDKALAAPLICQQSPLPISCTNLFLIPLISTAHQVTGFALPNAADGEQINRYIAENMPSSFGLKDVPEALGQANNPAIRIVGGRTMQCLQAGGQAIYFKFQRAGEPLETLAREGLLYQVIANTPELAGKFNSVLPEYRDFMRLPLGKDLEYLINQFDDPVEITESHGQRYINVFCYTAPVAYARYAHSPDTAEDCPWQRPEQGILRACHDAGYMTSMGLVPTSMLQCLHNTEAGRGWVALHSAMNLISDNVHAGKLTAWNTQATEKIDFGHCGMRDLGDYERFGHIHSCLRQKDTLETCYMPKVSQRIALANSICEIIVSAVLVRSRLRQGFAGYHYKNPQALNETAAFVESACNQFLLGLMPTAAAPISLRFLLGRDDNEYQAWLVRVAQEILYWTALQPDAPGFAQLPLDEYDPTDCYMNHINDQQHLSKALYPYDAYACTRHANFYDIYGQLIFGADFSTFPLISLMNGLTKMCTDILKQLNHSGSR
ncbi:DUF4116 domain-containing protein [Endozoicomonas sp. ALB115]|uniref:DUF4116 domain-containing protein n=1 Tax=Endozoicomonas sp. ALB115 TaxID=3403074 RepID=UPI003BB5BFF1